jgi:N-methylhydantoinase A
MIMSLRDLAIKRGVDPRETLLVAGGGAFGIHAAEIAKEIGVNSILIPKEAGVLSSYGGLISDIRQDFRATSFTTSYAFDFGKINGILEDLEKRANNFLDRTQVTHENRKIEYYMEARYPYQVYDLNIPLIDDRITEENLSKIVEMFHETHLKYYASNDPESHIEATAWRISGIGKTPKLRIKEVPQAKEDSDIAIKSRRKAYFRENGGFVDTPIYDADKLGFANQINGPAILEERITTIVIPPKCGVTVTKHGDYLLKLL